MPNPYLDTAGADTLASIGLAMVRRPGQPRGAGTLALPGPPADGGADLDEAVTCITDIASGVRKG